MSTFGMVLFGSEYQTMDNVPKLNFRIKYNFRNKL